MRLIHRSDRISGPLVVILLIMTQSLLPLIHGHGGYAEPIRGFHLPGFESLSKMGAETGIGITDIQYQGLDVIVSVACGIETRYPDAVNFDAQTLFAPIIPVFSGIMHSLTIAPSPTRDLTPTIPVGWTHLPSRAPPRF